MAEGLRDVVHDGVGIVRLALARKLAADLRVRCHLAHPPRDERLGRFCPAGAAHRMLDDGFVLQHRQG
jgi:hypothetical protein